MHRLPFTNLVRTLLRKARWLFPPAVLQAAAPLTGRTIVSYFPRTTFAEAVAEAGIGYADPALLDGETDERPAPNRKRSFDRTLRGH
jgi:hypothetical protein